MRKKRNKFRANIQSFVDCDYKHKLTKEELDWYERFEDEYYSNATRKKDSIHRQELSEEQLAVAIKETDDMTNSQNRDSYGIASTSRSYLEFIDDDNCFRQLSSDGVNINSLFDPKAALITLMNEVKDEISNDSGREISDVLHEFCYECVKLGATLKPYKVNIALRREKRKKENECEEQ